jgi:hypothetical protein
MTYFVVLFNINSRSLMSEIIYPTHNRFKEFTRSHAVPVEDEEIKAIGRWHLATPLRRMPYEHPLLKSIPKVTDLEVATSRPEPDQPLFEAQQMMLLGLNQTGLVTVSRGPDWRFGIFDGWDDGGVLPQHDVELLLQAIEEVDHQSNGLVAVSLGSAALAAV